MFDYNILPKADNKAFKVVCNKIENKLSIRKEPILIDVDGSLVQIYNTKDGKIKVSNDYLIDSVYIESDIDLSDFFETTPLS